MQQLIQNYKFCALFFCVVCTYYKEGFAQDYFQQEANYSIDVRLNDKEHELSAFETIEYVNNSPDTLTFLYFHLWPNAYKNNSTALTQQKLENGERALYYAAPKDKGYIDNLDFKINSKTVSWSLDSNRIDIAKLILNNPLLPQEKITITTPFNVKIPLGIFSRMGHMGESYQITQWYPKPAVYDRDGWHEMPYLDQGEFYSEYGTFDVKITLPKNYVVGATGDLIGGEQELAWLDSIVARTKEMDDFDTNMDFPESSETLKTLHYHQEKVHDFAWFADKRYHVLKGMVKLPHSEDTVTTWAMFTNNEADLWKKSIAYLNDAIYYYSLWNGDYPYKHATAVDGALSAGGGMEYPNVTVIGESESDFGLETVIMHEVGHNWFYGVLGSNERDHPWMDEGLNSFNENRYIETKYANANMLGDTVSNKLFRIFDLDNYKHKHQYYLGYLFFERMNLDQPVELHSADYTYINYGTIVYGKSAVILDYLMAYLGEDLFDQCMQAYFEKWKFKHPQPDDLRAVFEGITDKNLDWFFDDLVKTTKNIDYKIVGIKDEKVTVKNKGTVNSPFSISALRNDSIVATQWYDGFGNKNQVVFPNIVYDRLKIDALEDIPETNRNNNTLKAKGIFKLIEPIRFQFLGSLDDPDKTQLYYAPLMGYNTTDRFMIGLALYNHLVPQKTLEYVFAPMYALGSKNVVCMGKLTYHLLTKQSIFRQISFNISGSSFTYQSYSIGIEKPYYKIAPEINFYFSNKNKRSPNHHSITVKGIGIIEPEYLYDTTKTVQNNFSNNIYGIIDYYHHHKSTLKEWNNLLSLEMNKEFGKISLDSKLDIPFKDEHKGVHLRLFAGGFLFNNSNNPRFNYRMDGSNNFYDYKYEFVQLDRSNISSSSTTQLIENQGGFKVPASAGQSSKWMVALNIKTELPIPLPLGVFADAGINPSRELFFDAGIYIYVIRNYLEVYLPLLYSNAIKNTLGDKTPLELVRFTLNLNNANPFKLIKEFNF